MQTSLWGIPIGDYHRPKDSGISVILPTEKTGFCLHYAPDEAACAEQFIEGVVLNLVAQLPLGRLHVHVWDYAIRKRFPYLAELGQFGIYHLAANAQAAAHAFAEVEGLSQRRHHELLGIDTPNLCTYNATAEQPKPYHLLLINADDYPDMDVALKRWQAFYQAAADAGVLIIAFSSDGGGTERQSARAWLVNTLPAVQLQHGAWSLPTDMLAGHDFAAWYGFRPLAVDKDKLLAAIVAQARGSDGAAPLCAEECGVCLLNWAQYDDYQASLQTLAVSLQALPARLQAIMAWADRYNVPDCRLPRDVEALWQCAYLNLSTLQLKDVPEELGYLRHLTALDLSHNCLSSLPTSLAQLTGLTELDLGCNCLTVMPEWLASLTQLTVLVLWDNQLTVLPEWIGDLRVLRCLGLSHNQLAALPDSLGQLTELNELYLAHNQLVALPDTLVQAEGLQMLDLSHNLFSTAPEWLAQLPQLVVLDMAHNVLPDVPETLGQLPALTQLSLGGNQLEYVPDTLGGLSSLTTLDLRANRLQAVPAALGQLSRLSTLVLQDNCLTQLPEALGQLSCLVKLKLHGNYLSQVPDWLTQLPHLALLDLSDNCLTVLPDELGGLAALTELNVSGNEIEVLPASLGRLQRLLYLHVDSPLLLQVPEAIRQLPNLENSDALMALVAANQVEAEVRREVAELADAAVAAEALVAARLPEIEKAERGRHKVKTAKQAEHQEDGLFGRIKRLFH